MINQNTIRNATKSNISDWYTMIVKKIPNEWLNEGSGVNQLKNLSNLVKRLNESMDKKNENVQIFNISLRILDLLKYQ